MVVVCPRSFPLCVMLLCAACGGGDVEPDSSARPGAAETVIDVEWFVDRAAESGLDFIHFNGMSGEFYQPEIMGSGAALFDYDNDGDLDVLFGSGSDARGRYASRASAGRAAHRPPLPQRSGGGCRRAAYVAIHRRDRRQWNRGARLRPRGRERRL